MKQNAGIGGLGRFAEPAVLVLISLAAGPKHGYAITLDIDLVAGIHLGPGTLYGAIARLEERGLIEPNPQYGPAPAVSADRPWNVRPARPPRHTQACHRSRCSKVGGELRWLPRLYPLGALIGVATRWISRTSRDG